MKLVGNEQLKVQYEHQRILLKKQSNRLEQLQLEVVTVHDDLDTEKQKNAMLEQQLHHAQQQYTQILKTQFSDSVLAQEHERLKHENEELKNSYNYLIEHSAEQQVNLESDVTALKAKLQLLQSENAQLKKTKEAQDVQLTSYEQQLAQLANEKKTLQAELQQANDQIETMHYEQQQLIEQMQSINEQAVETNLEKRILTSYTEKKLSDGYTLLGDFLSELKNNHLYSEQLIELVW